MLLWLNINSAAKNKHDAHWYMKGIRTLLKPAEMFVWRLNSRAPGSSNKYINSQLTMCKCVVSESVCFSFSLPVCWSDFHLFIVSNLCFFPPKSLWGWDVVVDLSRMLNVSIGRRVFLGLSMAYFKLCCVLYHSGSVWLVAPPSC